jgi:hypothetical protein
MQGQGTKNRLHPNLPKLSGSKGSPHIWRLSAPLLGWLRYLYRSDNKKPAQ